MWKNSQSLLIVILLGFTGWANAEPAHLTSKTPKEPTNKLLHMYELFYLPFSIVFKQGKTPNDIFPLVTDKKGEFTQLLLPEQLKNFRSRIQF
ncbi:hypothetical protein EBQ90_07455 [bacterium]|nr:hypothetical protein [bacterium]